MNTWSRPARGSVLAAMIAAALTLSACGSDDSGSAADPGADATPGADSEAVTVTDPVVVTYDGGLYVLDGETLDVVADIPLDGFNRLNAAGDDRHVLVSTATGFRILDAVSGTLTDDEFAAPKPGHVVRHAERTVLFADGTGEVTIFDPHDLGEGLPETETYTAAAPHHGVAVLLESGELLVSIGTEEARTGALVLDADREEIARNEDCPGVHGEAAAQDEAITIGCQNGALIYHDGAFTKVDSPTEYGRIGNQAGSPVSPVVLGDYKQDRDAELERPEEIALLNTVDATLQRVELGTSYTFRSLGRGPHGEALVLGTDGALHVIDPETAEVTASFPVLPEAWEEPLDWQHARPALFVRDHVAYITDPAQNQIHAVDVESGEILATGDLPEQPNELSGVLDAHDH